MVVAENTFSFPSGSVSLTEQGPVYRSSVTVRTSSRDREAGHETRESSGGFNSTVPRGRVDESHGREEGEKGRHRKLVFVSPTWEFPRIDDCSIASSRDRVVSVGVLDGDG